MKTKIFLLVLVAAFLSACTAEKIVLEKMVTVNKEQFTKLKNEEILISTNKSVKVDTMNMETQQTFSEKKILNGRSIKNYNIKEDSLFIHDPNFRSIIALNIISAVKFKGVWDNELGFISENRLNDNLPLDMKKHVGGFIGFIVGGFLCGYLAANVINDHTDAFYGEVFAIAITGGVGGGYLCSKIFNSGPPNMDDVIKKIKEEQRLNNEP